MRELNIRAAGLTSVIWATGYTFDFRWIDLPVLDEKGEPVHDHGVARVPGIYFLGLPWLSRMNSSFLSGVGPMPRDWRIIFTPPPAPVSLRG